jgi:hypothetical protein
MIGRLGLLAVVAIAGIALGGCAEQTPPGQRNAAATPEATGSRTPSAAEPPAEHTVGGEGGDPEVFLARQAPDPDGFATALISGELVLEGRGCLRIARQRGPSPVPVWPSGYEARVEGDEVRVVNGRGRTVARVGEGIRAGGGEAESLNELGAVEREEAREIQERCPSGKYWLVGGGVKTTPRG